MENLPINNIIEKQELNETRMFAYNLRHDKHPSLDKKKNPRWYKSLEKTTQVLAKILSQEKDTTEKEKKFEQEIWDNLLIIVKDSYRKENNKKIKIRNLLILEKPKGSILNRKKLSNELEKLNNELKQNKLIYKDLNPSSKDDYILSSIGENKIFTFYETGNSTFIGDLSAPNKKDIYPKFPTHLKTKDIKKYKGVLIDTKNQAVKQVYTLNINSYKDEIKEKLTPFLETQKNITYYYNEEGGIYQKAEESQNEKNPEPITIDVNQESEYLLPPISPTDNSNYTKSQANEDSLPSKSTNNNLDNEKFQFIEDF